MIVYVAESRTAGGLAEPVYQDDVSIAPTLPELNVNRTPVEINVVPICTVAQIAPDKREYGCSVHMLMRHHEKTQKNTFVELDGREPSFQTNQHRQVELRERDQWPANKY